MKRKLSILPALLAFGSAWLASSCDSYVDITPLGSLTVDDANTYYELIANPQRCYYPSSFAYLSDDLWPKESKIIGFESTTIDAILFTANENAERSLIADNNLYENMYSDILRCNLVIDNIDAAQAPTTFAPWRRPRPAPIVHGTTSSLSTPLPRPIPLPRQLPMAVCASWTTMVSSSLLSRARWPKSMTS